MCFYFLSLLFPFVIPQSANGCFVKLMPSMKCTDEKAARHFLRAFFFFWSTFVTNETLLRWTSIGKEGRLSGTFLTLGLLFGRLAFDLRFLVLFFFSVFGLRVIPDLRNIVCALAMRLGQL